MLHLFHRPCGFFCFKWWVMEERVSSPLLRIWCLLHGKCQQGRGGRVSEDTCGVGRAGSLPDRDRAPCRSASLFTPVACFCSLARVMGKFCESPAVFMLLFCSDMGGGEQVPVLGTRVETVACRGLLRESWYLKGECWEDWVHGTHGIYDRLL